ncbi:MAG: galactose oxidase [Prosthecobacter sp.]|uniref:galactose oxidase n=1 Tax=Prosthecobacter sp. TaxID=1965333 RepID=UPI0038FDC234
MLHAADLEWRRLPDVPEARGFAGSFAGVSGGSLIVAGGTHFIDKMPWEGGTKLWYDTVFALDTTEGQWRTIGKLPKPNGYGVSITTPEGLVIIGGGNAMEHYRDVFWLDTKVVLAPLPKPCAFMSGCVLDDVIYIAGGIETPTATGAMNTFWSLQLKKLGAQWQELPPCPGKPRILACMAAADGAVHLFSGAALQTGPDGKPVREWLNDAWHFKPVSGWEKLPDVPRVAVAAPSPAPVIDSKILILGGDDGALVNFEPKSKHPGFPRSILVFDTKSQTWSMAGEVSFSLVTTNAVLWNDQIIVPGGETRPGVRSPQVWTAPMK